MILRNSRIIRNVPKLCILTIVLVFSAFFSSFSHADSMGWVNERNELRASYVDSTWWYSGNEVSFLAYISNLDEVRSMESGYADVSLISPSGVRIDLSRISFTGSPLEPQQMHSFLIE
jgi:hypothetical protein